MPDKLTCPEHPDLTFPGPRSLGQHRRNMHKGEARPAGSGRPRPRILGPEDLSPPTPFVVKIGAGIIVECGTAGEAVELIGHLAAKGL